MQQPLIKKYFRMDDGFRPSGSGQYNLFIELGAGNTSFAILHHDTGHLAGLGSFENPLFPVTDEFPWLRNAYRSLKVSIQNNRYTLIPSALYVPEEKETYTRFMLDTAREKEEVLADPVSQLDLTTLYAIPEKFHEKLKATLPGAGLFPVQGVLIRSIWVDHRNSGENLYLNVRQGAFDLLIFGSEGLHFCNSFEYQAPEDLAYYLIFVLEQLEIDPEQSGIILSGEITGESAEYDLIYRYIRRLKFISAPESLKNSTLFDDVPAHRFYSLLNMGLCGS